MRKLVIRMLEDVKNNTVGWVMLGGLISLGIMLIVPDSLLPSFLTSPLPSWTRVVALYALVILVLYVLWLFIKED